MADRQFGKGFLFCRTASVRVHGIIHHPPIFSDKFNKKVTYQHSIIVLQEPRRRGTSPFERGAGLVELLVLESIGEIL